MNENLLCEFSKEILRELPVGEKLSLLNELAKLEAYRLGIPEVEVKSQQFSVGTLGEYSFMTEELFIDLPIWTGTVRKHVSPPCAMKSTTPTKGFSLKTSTETPLTTAGTTRF